MFFVSCPFSLYYISPATPQFSGCPPFCHHPFLLYEFTRKSAPLFELVSHDSDKWQEAKRIINSLASERDSSFEIQISRKGENELMIRVNKQEKEKDSKK